MTEDFVGESVTASLIKLARKLGVGKCLHCRYKWVN